MKFCKEEGRIVLLADEGDVLAYIMGYLSLEGRVSAQ